MWNLQAFKKMPGEKHGQVFSVSTVLNRKDFNLNSNAALETGGVLVSDDVIINCEVQMVKEENQDC